MGTTAAAPDQVLSYSWLDDTDENGRALPHPLTTYQGTVVSSDEIKQMAW